MRIGGRTHPCHGAQHAVVGALDAVGRGGHGGGGVVPVDGIQQGNCGVRAGLASRDQEKEVRGRSVKLYGGKIRLACDIPRDTGFVTMEGVRPMDDSGKKVRERMTLTSGPGVSVREENGTQSSAVEDGRGGRACCLRAFGPAERAAGPRQGERGFGPLRRRRGGVRGLGRGQ